MSTHHEIHKLKSQAALLKYAAVSAAFLGAMFLAGSYGFGAGEHVQYKRDIATVQSFFKEHQRAVVFLAPGHRAAALFQDGVCTPYPQHVPQDHAVVYVARQWEPCSSKTMAPYEHPAQVRAKLAGLA